MPPRLSSTSTFLETFHLSRICTSHGQMLLPVKFPDKLATDRAIYYMCSAPRTLRVASLEHRRFYRLAIGQATGLLGIVADLSPCVQHTNDETLDNNSFTVSQQVKWLPRASKAPYDSSRQSWCNRKSV